MHMFYYGSHTEDITFMFELRSYRGKSFGMYETWDSLSCPCQQSHLHNRSTRRIAKQQRLPTRIPSMQRMTIININQARLVLTIFRNGRRPKLDWRRPRTFQRIVERIRGAKGAVDAAVHEDDDGRLVVWVEPDVRAEDGQLDAKLVCGEVEDVGGGVVELGGRGWIFAGCGAVVGILRGEHQVSADP